MAPAGARSASACGESARRVREIRTHLRGTYLADLEHLRRTPRSEGGSRGGGCGRQRRAEPGSTPRLCSARSADFAAAVNRLKRVAVSAADTWRDAIRASRLEARARRFANEVNGAGGGVFV